MGQQLSTDRGSSSSFSSSGEEDGKAAGGRGSFPSSSSSSAAAPVATTAAAAMQNKDSATSTDEQQQADRPSGAGSGLMSAFARTASGSSMMAKLFSAKRPSLPDMPPAVTTDTDTDNNARAMPPPAPKDDSPRLREINDDPFAEEHFVSSPHSSVSSLSRTSSVVMSPRTFEALDAEFKPPTLSRFFSATGNQLTRTDSKARIARLQSKHISDSDSDSSLDSDSSSDDEILQDDEIEVNDWLDEPEDAVFSPKQSNTRHSSFSSSSSTLHGAHSSNSLTGGPTTGRSSVSSSSNSITALATWLSSPDDQDDEMEDDDEPVLTPFMQENMPVYEVMKQVQLFRNLSQNQQEQVVRALKPTKFQNGEVIVQQGMRGSRFYMIAKGNAVVTKTTKNSNGQEQERMITHLHAGHYFGELALIYDDPRTATVRAIGDVELLYLTQEDFQRIGQVHLSLMLQQVPLLARLSARDQDIVLSRLKPANFNDGEYIVCQGEEGTRFYMITRGEAVVSERATTTTMNADGSTSTKNYEKELTRLYEGHVFGEMSLIYSEPRTASVRAVGPVKCLYLSKEDFDKCLLSDPFQRFIQESYVEKATRRAMRLRLQQRTSTTGKDGGATPATPGGGVAGGFGGAANSNPNTPTAIPPPAPTSPAKATETRKLVKQRLKNGQKVVNKYMIKGDLGKGTFGRVKLCQNEEDGKLYAVKIMHKTFVQRMAGKEDQLQDVLRREVAIMKKLNHRNVVKLVEVIDDPSSEKMYLVQEYVQHNLMDEVTRANGLNEEVARKYMRDLLSGLHYLHFHKVIHRDIKPENILVSAEGVAKIADFGTARMIMNESETLSGAKGTPAFMAPEMFNIDATYTGPSVDIWSLGATLYMMVIGRPPWLADNEIILAERVQRDELKFPKESERTMEPHLKNLIQRMLTKDPSLRLTLTDCFNHDWITKEGSEPLGLAAQENDLTVSFDESERAIQNIPERIDLSLSESLARAHLLVKTRQQVGGGVVRTSSGHSLGMGTPVSGQLENRIPTAASISSTSSSTSPSRSSTEEVSRVINAWRHHKRVHLMDGHKELSARSKELLLEQKRMAFSVDRAKVTEIILPAAGPTARSRYPSSSSVNPNLSTTSSNNSSDGSLPGSPRHQSSPNVFTSRNNSVESNPLLKKRSSSRMIDTDHGNLEGFGRTSFTSVTRLSDGLFTTNTGGVDDSGDRDSLSSSSDGGGEARGATTDLDLMKRSLSRKKDFLMVTSEVFRNEDGDYQSRKILFQAKDEDFSVASRVPTHSKSGRELGRASSSQTKSSSRKSINSSPFNNSGGSLASNSSNGSGSKRSGHRRSSSSVDEFNMDDLDCVQVTEVDDEDEDDEDDEKSRARGFSKASAHSQRHDEVHSSSSDSDDESVYSDVEGDVDVDATFNDLIGTPNNINLCADDEEIAPLDPPSRGSSASNLLDFQKQSIVQVYVSSKIRENLKLGIRSGYAEAKMSRSYMEDKSTGIAECNLTKFDPSVADAFESLAFFGVYDGHNGDDTAVWLQRELHNRFFMHPQFVSEPMEAIATVCDAIDHEILNAQNRSMLPKRKRATTNGDYDEDDDEDEEVEEICDENDMTCHLQPISFSGAVSVFAVLAKRKKRRVEEEETTVEESSAVEAGGDTEEKTVDEAIEPKEAEEADNGDVAAADAADEAEQKEMEPADQLPINAGLKIIIPTDDITAEDADITESKANDEPQTTLYIANVGDCRAVLCTADGLAVELTKDHKAALPEEKARIEASGGFVHNGRLDGILAISRGFGDLAHKQDGHLIATPDIYERAIGPDDEFLLLASDGLFDVLSSQQSVNFIRRKLLTHGDVQLAAQEMLLKAQQYFAHDNISVIIVALNQEASELT